MQARPRPLASYALHADARPLDQQEKLVGDALGLTFAALWGVAGLAYPPHEVSLAARPAAPSAATVHDRGRG